MGSQAAWSGEVSEMVARLEEALVCRVALRGMEVAANRAIKLDASGTEDALARLKLPARGQRGQTAEQLAGTLIDGIGEQAGDVVETGFRGLDANQALWRGEELVIAARTSVGKSQLGLQIAGNVAKRGGRVLFASLEMRPDRALARIAASDAGVSYREAALSAESLTAYSSALARLAEVKRMVILPGPMTSLELWSKARWQADQWGGLDLIVADHLRLFRDENQEERHRLGAISANLREVAKEMNCNLILLTQINRKVEAADDKRPGLAMLRDSGEIEENADVVVMIYRKAYHDVTPGGSRSGVAEVYAAKNRDGKLWGTRLWFDGNKGPRFTNLTSEKEEGRGNDRQED